MKKFPEHPHHQAPCPELKDLFDEINTFCALTWDGWDGEDANPVTLLAIQAARLHLYAVYSYCMRHEIPWREPSVGPLADGGVVVGWDIFIGKYPAYADVEFDPKFWGSVTVIQQVVHEKRPHQGFWKDPFMKETTFWDAQSIIEMRLWMGRERMKENEK